MIFQYWIKLAASNHYHVIHHIDTEQASVWNDEEIIERWERLFRSL
ncbi:MAG: hypothetical protein K1563_16925 [Candidatus Thiodiazotropha sp. (ex. Lucinisca nassula)]|nr:hypothetical protein [Candidatus Thiodiazotropha sp. (ex. Lucinisca nassula)]MBW9275365.1 hypothetical protein [Candidatus Thiodiazotropha sp. (ex. Lucinisca nassula)]